MTLLKVKGQNQGYGKKSPGLLNHNPKFGLNTPNGSKAATATDSTKTILASLLILECLNIHFFGHGIKQCQCEIYMFTHK